MRSALRTRCRSRRAISAAGRSGAAGRMPRRPGSRRWRPVASARSRRRRGRRPARSRGRGRGPGCRARRPGPTAPSALDGPIGRVRQSRPPERSAHEAWLSAWSTSSASQPLGCSRAMTSSEAVSTSSTSTEARTPVRSSSTGAKPTARAHRDQRAAAAGLVDDDRAAPAVVAHPQDRGERAQRRPGGDRLAGAARQAERAGEGPRPRRRRRRRRGRRWPAPTRAGRPSAGSGPDGGRRRTRWPDGRAGPAAGGGAGPAGSDRLQAAARVLGARLGRRPAPRCAPT